MFSGVSSSYDIINRLLSFGFDQIWRKRAAHECLKHAQERVLDLCCGTGDLAIRLSKKASPEITVFALDFSEGMLETAKKKAGKRNLNNIDFYHADAAVMPFPDGFFDSIGIAFAFRNLTYHNPDRSKFLREIHRVLKPGGRFVIIETSQPDNKLIRKLFHIYLEVIVPAIGGLISGKYGAYKYLGHSASNYYHNKDIKDLLLNAGFNYVEQKPFFSGTLSLHITDILQPQEFYRNST